MSVACSNPATKQYVRACRGWFAVGQAIPGGAFPQIGSVKPVKGDATYIGIALTLKPQMATADLFVPGTAMNVMTKMIAPLFRNVE